MRTRVKCQPRIENDPDYKYAKILKEITGTTLIKALHYIRKYETLTRAKEALVLDNQVQQFKTK